MSNASNVGVGNKSRNASTLRCFDVVGKHKKRRKKHRVSSGGEKSFYRLSFSLIGIIWCLAFLFYTRLGRSHENQDGLILQQTNDFNVLGGRNKVRDTDFSEKHSFSANSSRRKEDAVYQSCSIPQSNRLDVIWDVLYCSFLDGESNRYSATEESSERSQHSTYLNFEEFRNLTRSEKAQGLSSELVNITHRLEPDGKEYNYASAFKGAKVVAHNKEAKGAANILGKDHDKYLRNPCSVARKFVVIELSDETLVDVVKIANFEHYSSNFKEFELFGSLKYPTDTWKSVGKFVAANVKQIQSFKLADPNWVRYLNISLLSHYGSEFYCTLSVVEIYGVDAIERLLEDLLETTEESAARPYVRPNATKQLSWTDDSSSTHKVYSGVAENKVVSTTTVEESMQESQCISEKVTKNPLPERLIADPLTEVRQQPLSRVPGDTVMKILMQKVRSLELNLFVLEEYVKELNRRQGDVFPELDQELSRMSIQLENNLAELKSFMNWKANVEKDLMMVDSLKAVISSRLDAVATENTKLRLEVEKVAHDQASIENKEVAVLAVSFLFMLVALAKLVSSGVWASIGWQMPYDSCPRRWNGGWLLMLGSSSMTILITLLST